MLHGITRNELDTSQQRFLHPSLESASLVRNLVRNRGLLYIRATLATPEGGGATIGVEVTTRAVAGHGGHTNRFNEHNGVNSGPTASTVLLRPGLRGVLRVTNFLISSPLHGSDFSVTKG